MKRTLSICLAMVLVISLMACLVGCGGGGKAGKYQLTKINASGLDMNIEDLKEQAKAQGIEFECYIDLKEDGTGTFMTPDGDKMDLTWDDSNLTVADMPMPYTISGNTLSIEQDGASMTFEK